jgi:hypothetical protein
VKEYCYRDWQEFEEIHIAPCPTAFPSLQNSSERNPRWNAGFPPLLLAVTKRPNKKRPAPATSSGRFGTKKAVKGGVRHRCLAPAQVSVRLATPSRRGDLLASGEGHRHHAVET